VFAIITINALLIVKLNTPWLQAGLIARTSHAAGGVDAMAMAVSDSTRTQSSREPQLFDLTVVRLAAEYYPPIQWLEAIASTAPAACRSTAAPKQQGMQ
jgi:hypothetical protein